MKNLNLKEDAYFYDRKAHLDKTIKAIEDGSMKTYDFNDSMDELMEELES